jgi:hypothetical protein
MRGHGETTMTFIRTCMLICVVPLALAWQGSLAGQHNYAQIAAEPESHDASASRTSLVLWAAPASSRRTHGRSAGRSRHRAAHKSDPFADAPIARAAHPAANPKKWVRADALAARNAVVREDAEREARAERLYRSSQLSAPIVKDAKACKRTSANGMSIYENC